MKKRLIAGDDIASERGRESGEAEEDIKGEEGEGNWLLTAASACFDTRPPCCCLLG